MTRRAGAWLLLALLLPAARAAAEDPKAPAPSGFWTADELRLIDRALEVANCDRKDLGFQKRPIDDPFRLAVVDRVLDDPLSVGEEVRSWSILAALSPEVVLSRAGSAVGLPMASPGTPPVPIDAAGLPDAVRDALRTTLGRVAGTRAAVEALRRSLGESADETLRTAAAAMRGETEEPPPAAFLERVRVAERAAPCGAADHLTLGVQTLVARLGEAVAAGWGVPAEGLRVSTSAGTLVVSSARDDVHDEGDDVVLVIDLGGDDTWRRGASAGATRPVCVCIDLAGDDRYVGRRDLSFGAALGGVAIQWDAGGNDLYDAGHASLGAGILGVGVLVDEGGDDVYRCRDFGIGAGAFGIGIHLDTAGNDQRHCDLYGEGFGATWGVGVCVDQAGNDVYDAGGVHSDAPLHRDRTLSMSQGFGFGMRPDASGGVGLLVDLSGNDRYSADVYGQGASYWYALGLLIDGGGNDTYVLGHYGQGAGIHLSAGMLYDAAGQDLYYTEYGVGIGGAHDLSVGVLLDRQGDDHYVGSGGSQGGALSNSVALLLDGGGDDEYAAIRAGASHGAAAPARDTGGIALFVDAGGKDSYGETARDGGAWTQGFVGAGLDEPAPPDAPPPPDPMGASITAEQANARVDEEGTVARADGTRADDLDRLWKIAIRWQVGDERVIGPIARARLVALGDPALARAIERLGTKDGLEAEAVLAVLQAFPGERTVPRLIEASKSADAPVRKAAARFLGSLGAAEAEPRLVELLEDADARLFALRSLAALKRAPPGVERFLRGPQELEGVAAVSCLGSVGDERAVAEFVAALSPDTPFLVRQAAEQRLAALGERAVPALARAAAGAATARERRSALRALGGTKSPAAAAPIVAALAAPDPWVRLSALGAGPSLAAALPAEEARALRAALAAARERETDPVVRRYAPR